MSAEISVCNIKLNYVRFLPVAYKPVKDDVDKFIATMKPESSETESESSEYEDYWDSYEVQCHLPHTKTSVCLEQLRMQGVLQFKYTI